MTDDREGPLPRRTQRRSPLTVLIIEADAARRAAIHERLVLEGFEVMSAFDVPDAEAALSWTRRHVAAVVVSLDVRDGSMREQSSRLAQARPQARLLIAPRHRASRPDWCPPPGVLLIELTGDSNGAIASAVRDALVALDRSSTTP